MSSLGIRGQEYFRWDTPFGLLVVIFGVAIVIWIVFRLFSMLLNNKKEEKPPILPLHNSLNAPPSAATVPVMEAVQSLPSVHVQPTRSS